MSAGLRLETRFRSRTTSWSTQFAPALRKSVCSEGQDVILRRRLEATEKEMKRLQEETAEQQAELRAIHATMTMRALAPAREFYSRLRRAAR